MKKIASAKIKNFLLALCSVAVILVVWLVAYCGVKNDYVVPSVADSLAELLRMFGRSAFWTAFFNTVFRTAIAFLISFLLAAAFAVASVLCRPFRRVFAGIVSVVRALPTMALTVVLLLWATPRIAPVVVTCLVLFPMIYTQLIAAADGVDERLLQMAKVYRLSFYGRLRAVYLPQIAPETLLLTGANLSFGIKLTVSAEVLSYTAASLGGWMQQARLYAEMPTFAALTLVCVLFGLLVEAVFSVLVPLICRWRKKEAVG